MRKNKLFHWTPDRSGFPTVGADGKPVIDLDSHKFVKIWHGPNHPGVTGNMSLELTISGDEIMESKTHVGYLHRGFEKLYERRTWIQCFPTVVRMCVPESDSNEYNLSAGIEELAGIEIPEMATWLRTLALEMSRLQALLRIVPAQGGTLGLGLGVQWGVYLRDLILDRFEELTGGRIYHMYMIPGGVRGLLPDGFKDRLEENLKLVDEFALNLKRLMLDNSVFKKRTVGTAYIPPEWVDKYGIVGFVSRAAGVMKDVRKDYPYLAYDQLDFEPAMSTDSDIYARTVIRWKDMISSVDLLRQIMAKMPTKGEIKAPTPNVLHWEVPKGEVYVRSESTRGEYGFYIVSDGTKYPRRINLRGPSYTHAVSLLEKLLVNANISDIAATMVSLQTCPPEIER